MRKTYGKLYVYKFILLISLLSWYGDILPFAIFWITISFACNDAVDCILYAYKFIEIMLFGSHFKRTYPLNGDWFRSKSQNFKAVYPINCNNLWHKINPINVKKVKEVVLLVHYKDIRHFLRKSDNCLSGTPFRKIIVFIKEPVCCPWNVFHILYLEMKVNDSNCEIFANFFICENNFHRYHSEQRQKWARTIETSFSNWSKYWSTLRQVGQYTCTYQSLCIVSVRHILISLLYVSYDHFHRDNFSRHKGIFRIILFFVFLQTFVFI